MSFLTGLKVFGSGVEKIFSWFGSPTGQAVVKAGEGFLGIVIPGSIPISNLFNVWAQKAYTVEALAVAAGQATGTGTDKAILAISSIGPTVLQYAQDEGLSPRTAAQIAAANKAVIDFINAMTQPAT